MPAPISVLAAPRMPAPAGLPKNLPAPPSQLLAALGTPAFERDAGTVDPPTTACVAAMFAGVEGPRAAAAPPAAPPAPPAAASSAGVTAAKLAGTVEPPAIAAVPAMLAGVDGPSAAPVAPALEPPA